MGWRGIYRYVVATAMLCILANTGYAQKSDTLKPVMIHARKQITSSLSQGIQKCDFAPGQEIVRIDSISLLQFQYQSMANLLAQEVPVFIKSYGFNSLATLSFRGASAAQSSVLWNGVPIQSAALGVTDVSLLHVSLLDKVDILYGGSSALLGSGNVGGALLLQSDAPIFDTAHRSLSVSGSTGSFSQYTGALKMAINNKKWYFSFNGYGQYARDNFQYTDLAGTKQTTQNAALSGGGAIAEAAYKFADKNIISLTAWYQYDNRDIPAALFEAFSHKNSISNSLRTLLQWHKEVGRNKWYIKSSLIRDELVYNDAPTLQHSHNTTYQYYQEIGWQRHINEHSQWLVFIPTEISWMKMQPDTLTRSIFKTAIAGAYQSHFFNNKLNAAINARAEVVNGSSYLLPGIDASYRLARWATIRGNVQRTYRVPTLNELYYVPGGNPTLKPEQGWAQDAGYSINIGNGSLVFHHDLSMFNRNIKDWILWFGGAIWTPHNIAEVHSRGVETQNELLYTIHKFTFHASVNTSYIVATTVSSYVPNDGSVGKQIPYTPIYNGQANIGFAYNALYVNYNHTYTGYRYITTDESEYLSPYQTGNMQVMYSIKAARPVQLLLQCNNIWNNHYAIVSYRPMPGINYVIGAKFAILQ